MKSSFFCAFALAAMTLTACGQKPADSAPAQTTSAQPATAQKAPAAKDSLGLTGIVAGTADDPEALKKKKKTPPPPPRCTNPIQCWQWSQGIGGPTVDRGTTYFIGT